MQFYDKAWCQMCDTFVTFSTLNSDPVVVFGKNSDREPNEAQHLVTLPAVEYPPKTQLACTYIRIPQVARTHAVLLSKPFWMWGAEMGVNEHGVAIGNEAVFTLATPAIEPGLLGMDLVRLGLERSHNAREAVDIIVSLLEAYGQGGSSGYTRDFRYDNSFLIADPRDAWLVETAGREWVAKHITGPYAISNGLSISDDWDLSSIQWLSNSAVREQGENQTSNSFAAAFTDQARTLASGCSIRKSRMLSKIGAIAGSSLVEGATEVLRDHGASALWGHAGSPPQHKSVCMHSSGSANAISQTNGSLIAILHPTRPICFATGTAAPCTSVFKPIWVDLPVPGHDSPPNGQFRADVLFWRHELLHRRLIRADFDVAAELLEGAKRLERQFATTAVRIKHADIDARAQFSESSFKMATNLTDEWTKRPARSGSSRAEPDSDYLLAWQELNRLAGLPAQPGL